MPIHLSSPEAEQHHFKFGRRALVGTIIECFVRTLGDVEMNLRLDSSSVVPVRRRPRLTRVGCGAESSNYVAQNPMLRKPVSR